MPVLDVRRTVIAGILLGFAFLVLDLVAFVNPVVFSVTAPYLTLSIWKSPSSLGTSNVVFLPFLFELVNGIILAGVWFLINPSIPGKAWRKGLNYGIIVGLFRVLMGAFSTYVMYAVPDVVLVTTTIASFIEILVLGILTQMICERIGKI